ncbi:MAG: non-hydrolyzing UDP-N-acetylglucosamine 2-epimerase [Cytophagaceae bacterium]
MKKIIAIVGARPQFIKHAPMILELSKFFVAKTIHTGQHYDENMSKIFFDQLNIPRPEFQLSTSGVLHGEQTGHMLVEIEKILVDEKPDFVLVYGDTNSTLAGALAASKLSIPIVHVEAGLRSYNKSMPEEINRILTDHVSEILFCPSKAAEENLIKEGVSRNVHICGDVMKDMLTLAGKFLKDPQKGTPYVFVTIHRPYNTDGKERIFKILKALDSINTKIVFSIHPRTLNRIKQFDIDLEDTKNIEFIPPVGYFEALSFQKFSSCVITDSGGIQKEAYWLKKKCITLRPETEWVETTYQGWNQLLFNDLEQLPELIAKPEPVNYDANLYGNGHSASGMVEIIKKTLI